MASTCEPHRTAVSSSSSISDGMTQEDVGRLAKHFKDPKFCEMFEEYARELADPKAKAESDAYLAQLESAGELEGMYGKGVQVIQADPGMVVKTKTADGAARVYINICTCPKVGVMVVEPTSTAERRGCNITLPNMMNSNSNREGTAPDGGPFKTHDFIVHPDTLTRCVGKADLLEHLVTTAIERVEEVTQVKLLRKYKLPKVPYKGVGDEQRPPALLQRTAAGGDVVDGRLRPLCSPGGGLSGTGAAAAGAGADVTSTSGASASKRDAGQHSTSGRSGFSFGSKAKRPSPSSKAADSQDTSPTSRDSGAPPGVQTPAYQVVERARVDLGSAWGDTGRALQYSNTPEALVVRVELPGVPSAANIQLSMGADSLALEVPGKYKLQLSLKHKVSEQQATAKFITAKQMMVLTLPVVQPAAPDHSTPSQMLVQPLPQEQLSHKESQLDQEQADRQQQQQELEPDRPEQSPTATQQAAIPSPQHDGSNTAGAEQSTPQEPPAGSPAAVTCNSSMQQAGVTGSMQQAGVTGTMPASPVVEQCAAHSSSQPQPVKTENQLRWEALHQQQPPRGDTPANTDPEVSHAQQQSAATVAPAQPALSQAQPCAAAAGKVAAPLRPRLASRRISAADFV